MSIITWMESGRKCHAIFDPRYFSKRGINFPVLESHRKSLQDVISHSEDDILLVSGDRKRFRIIPPLVEAHADRQDRQIA